MKSAKGTRDLLPQEMVIFELIERTAREHFGRYGFRELRTPIFEETALFLRGIGEGTDIVNKEMYTFLDKGERSMTLRPELTAPVCRAVIQHHLVEKGEVVRLLYMGPAFRYERPQAGRYRQFYQLGCEVFGDDDPLIDIETIDALWRFLKPFALPNLELILNSVGDDRDRPVYLAYVREALDGKRDQLCGDCQVRLDKNVLRIFDCKVPKCRELVATLDPITAYLNDTNRLHFEKVTAGLNRAGIPFRVDPLLVRGLDYYTKTAFELVSGDLGAQSAVMGGGRYDRLVEALGGSPTPAFGWAMGIDRLASILAQHRTLAPARPDAFFVFGRREWLDEWAPFINDLRDAGLFISYDLRAGSFKSQIKRANRENAAFAAILGEDEYARGIVSLKNMSTSQQIHLPKEQLAAYLKAASATASKANSQSANPVTQD